MRATIAAVLALAASAWAAPVAASAPTTLDAGGVRTYVRADGRVPLAHFELVLRAGSAHETEREDGLAALVAQAILRTPVGDRGGTPLALEDAIAAHGGGIAYGITPQSVRFALDAPAASLGTIAPLLARALAAPRFDAAALAQARTALAERTTDESRDPRLVGIQMLRTSYYAGSAAFAPFGNAVSLARQTAADAQAFYGRWYVRGGALATVAGASSATAEATARTVAAALPAGDATEATIATHPFGAHPKRIVTTREGIAVSSVVLGFAAPSYGSRDFAAALVVRALLDDVVQSDEATTVPPYRRAIVTAYTYDVTPAQLTVWLNGAKLDASTGLTAIDEFLKRAAKDPLAADVLARAKSEARGAWALERQTSEAQAWDTAIAVGRGLDPGYGETVGAAIDAVGPTDVKRVVAASFRTFDLALILPREASAR